MLSIKEHVKPFIVETKSYLRNLQDVKKTYNEISNQMKKEVETIRNSSEKGLPVIPEISYDALRKNTVSRSQINKIKHRGCVVIHGVFEKKQASDWNDEIGHYIEKNDYIEKMKDKAGMDKYFDQLDSSTPQIFGLYWSKPQVQARQAETMAITKRFLNSIWNVSSPTGDEFDPNHDYSYADRTRRRQPGDKTLGLSPHMDAGSYERWIDPAFQKIYHSIFSGDWESYNPWLARYRTQTREFKSPAVCSMFRTFQGWTSLTTQGPSDGTLSVIPISNSISFILMRALQDDIPDDDLCEALPGKALGAIPKYHEEILEGLISIPEVGPGDTVWWHPDIIHSLPQEHIGKDYANAIYIGASPKCLKNEYYARSQALSFLKGESPPDFAPENFEKNFIGRATLEDLTELGRSQMVL